MVTAVLRNEVYRDIELVEVFCGEINDKKHTSELISALTDYCRQLNAIHPLSELPHLKRVRSRRNGSVLEVLIALPRGEHCQEELRALEQSLQWNPKIIGLGKLYTVKVPKSKPITRTQYEDVAKYWPTHFHEDKRLEKALRGELFSQNDFSQIEDFMRIAIAEAKEAQLPSVGAVVVDPSTNRIVTQAHTDSNHPLKHAVMVCIDNVASVQGAGAWKGKCSLLQPSSPVVFTQGEPAEQFATGTGGSGTHSIETKEVTEGSVIRSPSHEECPPAKRLKKEGQYLCSGYDLYTTREPCVMCSMALVHSRIGRVFYGCLNPSTGGLGSQYKIHTQQGINHHFEVYSRVLEQQCLDCDAVLP